MSIHNADLETDLFFVEKDDGFFEDKGYRCDVVMRRGLVEARETDNKPTGVETPSVRVCVVNPDVDGAAEEIAAALNRKPKLERLLIEAAAVLRSGDEKRLNALADQIEEAIVNG